MPLPTFGRLAIIAATFASLCSSAAAAASLNYSGRILKPDNTPVTASGVAFTIQVKSPAGCIVYEETQSANLAASNGAFSLVLNGGASARGANDPGNSFDQLFSNNQSLIAHAAGSCGASYSPASTDARLMTVLFDDGNVPQQLPDQAIAAVPNAVDSAKVAGFPATSLLRVTANGLAAGAPAAGPILNPAGAAELMNVIGGISAQYAKAGANGANIAPGFAGDPSAPSAGEYWYDSSAHALKYFDGTSVVTMGAGGGPTSGSAITSGTIGGTTAINTSGSIVSSGSVAAGTLSGALVAGASVTAQTVSIYNASNTFAETIRVPASLSANLSFILPASAGTSGYVLTTDGAGSLSWSAPGGAGTVTNVVAGSGLSGGAITASGTIAFADTAVAAGTYGDSTHVTQAVVDAQGRITSAANVAIGGLDASALSSGTIAAARLPASAGVWSLNGSDAYYGGGNVGIGTTTPGAPLDVKGAIRMSGSTSGYAGFQPAAAAGNKAVLEAEYTSYSAATSQKAAALNFSTAFYNLDLNGKTYNPCP